jgi:hypothetical protein
LVTAARHESLSFRESTRQKVTSLPSSALNTATNGLGGPDVPITLPNSGYMGNIYLQAKGTLSTSAGSPAGSFNTYPYLPFSLVKKIILTNNMGGALVNVSGWGLTLLNLCRARMRQLENPNVGQWGTTNIAAIWAAPLRTTVVAASTAYPVSAVYEIPVPTDDALELGLLLAQSNNLYNQLIITPAALSDVVGTITGVGALTETVNLSTAVEYFDIPADSQSQPERRWLHNIFEDVQTNVTANSDIIYKPSPGPVYLRIVGMVEAGGVPVGYGTITKLQFRYGQSNYVYTETYDQHINRMFWKYGIVLPDGMFVYDYTLGYGQAGIVEPRDFMDTSQFTDVQIAVSVGALGSSPQVRYVKEFLALDQNFRQ